MKNRQFTPTDKDSFDRDGYVIVRSFFSPEEAELLLNASIQDENVKKKYIWQRRFGRY